MIDNSQHLSWATEALDEQGSSMTIWCADYTSQISLPVTCEMPARAVSRALVMMQGPAGLTAADMSEMEREFMQRPDDSSDDDDDDEEALNHCSDDDSELAADDF